MQNLATPANIPFGDTLAISLIVCTRRTCVHCCLVDQISSCDSHINVQIAGCRYGATAMPRPRTIPFPCHFLFITGTLDGPSSCGYAKSLAQKSLAVSKVAGTCASALRFVLPSVRGARVHSPPRCGLLPNDCGHFLDLYTATPLSASNGCWL